MPIISVRDNENSRGKRNAEKKTKTEKNKEDKNYSERVRVKFELNGVRAKFIY